MNKKINGITLISLIITIIILLILAGVVLNLAIGNKGIFNITKQASEETTKQMAKEKINLKITDIQTDSYIKTQNLPTLKQLSFALYNDNEIEYVSELPQTGNTQYEIGENPTLIYTKLKEYPYEFEIDSSLKIASINQTNLTTNRTSGVHKIGTYTGVTVPSGTSLNARMKEANTIEINIQEKYSNYKNLTKDNFLAVDQFSFSGNDTYADYICYGSTSTIIENYEQESGILTIVIAYGFRDAVNNSYDSCYPGSTTIYLLEQIP